LSGYIGLVAREQTRDHLDEDGVGRAGLEAPGHAKTQRLFGAASGGVDPVLGEKDPHGVHLPYQASDKLPSIILPVVILVDQTP